MKKKDEIFFTLDGKYTSDKAYPPKQDAGESKTIRDLYDEQQKGKSK